MCVYHVAYWIGAMTMVAVTSTAYAEERLETATFAGGCFWCVESAFKGLPGVTHVISGYTGGTGENPTYEDYASKGHVEAVQITYDPSQISYRDLLDVFWKQIDPTDAGGQFVDRGRQYRTAIFYHTRTQQDLAERSRDKMNESHVFKKQIVTEIAPAGKFYKAEESHQNFCVLNPTRYRAYRQASGRDAFLSKIWDKKGETEAKPVVADPPKYKKLSTDQLRKKLTPLQCDVIQKGATERPFDNPYWNSHREGIYVDVVSGEPLFSSLEKFDSKTGWPSFTRPLEPGHVMQKEDDSLSQTRIEVRSKDADSHLGHVFNDGPAPTGLRYCINSAALRFIPKEDLEKEGYGKYKKLFP